MTLGDVAECVTAVFNLLLLLLLPVTWPRRDDDHDEGYHQYRMRPRQKCGLVAMRVATAARGSSASRRWRLAAAAPRSGGGEDGVAARAVWW